MAEQDTIPNEGYVIYLVSGKNGISKNPNPEVFWENML